MVYLGTGVGLSIFDGNNVVNIHTGISQGVVAIFEHLNDSLILIRDNGVSIVSIKNFGYREYDFSEIFVDKIIGSTRNGNYIYCTTSEKIGVFDIRNLKYTPIDSVEGIDKEATFVSRSSIYFSQASQRLYIAHNKGISSYKTRANKLNLIQAKLPWDTAKCGNLIQLNQLLSYKVPGKKIIVLNETTGNYETYRVASVYSTLIDDKLLYSRSNYVFTYSFKTKLTDSFDLGSSHIIYKIIQGQGDNLLVASASGLIVIGTKSQKPTKELTIIPPGFLSEQGLQKKYRFQNLFFLNTKNGLIAYDSLNGTSEFVPLDKKIGLRSIQAFIPFTNNNLIICGEGGYCGFDVRSRQYYKLQLFSDSSEAIIKNRRAITGYYNAKDSFLVMTFYRQPIKFIDLKTKKEGTWNGFDKGWFRTVRSIQYDKDGYYWLGANGNDGLIHYNFKTEDGYYINAAEFTKAGNNSALINQILVNQPFLYLCTADGVVKMDTRNKSLLQLTVEGKPYHDQVYGAAMIQGRLYFSTRNYLCTLGEDGHLLKLQYYPNYAGAGIPFEAHSSVFLSAGNKLFQFQIPDISVRSNVFISHISVQDKWYTTAGLNKYIFPFGSGSLQILFGNNHLISLDNGLHVYYKFSGDKQWQILKGSSIQTGNLNYGDHSLSFYSVNWGIKSKISEFTITISRPWWASLWFYGSTLVLFIAGIYFILKFYNRSIEDSRRKKLALILETTENERNRISRDFHDSIGSKLSSIKLITENVSAGGDQILFNQLPGLVDEIIGDVRTIISELSPQQLELYGLISAVESLINGLRKQFPGIRFVFEMSAEFPRLKKECEIHLFRIIQELINNSIKHANCSKLDVSLNEQNGQIQLVVKDDGKWKDSRMGHGLINSESRVNIMGGSMNISKSNDRGTEVKIVLSLDACSTHLSS